MTGPSLYRRHRPRTFDDVVGQEHVVRTLRNAIEQGKVHHAYLFVGSRGTGKTSMAKILAACLNCQGDPDLPPEQRRVGPTTTPCGRCEACRSIADATSIDVVEMDAASNNSVDDIRDLRDAVAFAPVGGRSKVYILDEAHMLSSAAWNAFLKTLEEPPPRTIFVLATTEANKVLPTVVDRCHRFDFHRPTPDQLGRVLARVAEQERIAIDPEAVALVARHATGSFRDALGTLEQLVTYAGERITNEDVLSVLGVADAELLFRAVDAIAAGDGAAVLQVAAELSAQGRDLSQVTRDLEGHARALLLVRMTGGLPEELSISPDRDRRTVEQAQRLPGATVIRILDLVAAALAAVRDGADPRTQLELLLLRAAVPQIDPQTKALAARIERLEQALSGGTPPPASPPAGDPRDGAAASTPPPGPAGAPSAHAAPMPDDPSGGRAGSSGHAGPTANGLGIGPDAGHATAPGGAPSPGAAVAHDPGGRGRAATLVAEPRGGVPAPPAPGPTPGPPSPAPPGPAPDPAPPVPTPDPQPGPPLPEPSPEPQPGPPDPQPPAPSPYPGPAPGPPGPPAPTPHPPTPAPRPAATGAPSPTAVEPQPAAHQAGPAASAVGPTPADIDELLPTIAERLSRPVAAALQIASTVHVGPGELVLGVPHGKASAVRLLDRDDTRQAIGAAIQEFHGLRVQVRAEERADVAVATEEPLPEEEVLLRVKRDFEAEEITESGGAVAAGPDGDGA